MNENIPNITELLKQYPCKSSGLENIKSAQEILSTHYCDADKAYGIELINYNLKEHFVFKTKDVQILERYWNTFKRTYVKKIEEKSSQEKEEFEAHQAKLMAQEAEEKRNAKADRIGKIHRLEATLKNEDGKASVQDILDARKQLKDMMKDDFWTVEGMNPKTGNIGHLSLRKIAIADYLYKAYNIVKYGGRNWWYDWESAYYRFDNNDVYLNKEVSDIMKEVGNELYQYNGNSATDCNSILKLACDTDVYIDNPFNLVDGCINAKNGVLSIDYKNRKVTLIGKKPSFKFSYCINTRYDESAKSDTIFQELINMIGLHQAELIVQLCAIAIRDTDPRLDPSKIAYMFIGKRDAGKSVVQEIIKMFFGEKIVSHEKLLKIAEDKFTIASLEGKLINIDGELPENLPLSESSMIKDLTGKKMHSIEKKGIQSYDGIITAIMVFAGNQFPRCKVSKDDSAFWDRWEIINFPKRFPKRANFMKELFTPENMSCFFNRVIQKLFDLHEGHIIRNLQTFDVFTQWMNSSSSVFRFMDRMTDACDTIQEYTKKELYAYYHKWCDLMKIPKQNRAMTIRDFSYELVSKCDVKIGRTGSYISGIADERDGVYRMYRTYEEINAIEYYEPIYHMIDGVPHVEDEDGNLRCVSYVQ